MCKGGRIAVTGEINADLLECGILRYGFVKKRINKKAQSQISGKITAETFEILDKLNLNFEYVFKNIISSEILRCEDEITCENFYSFGGLEAGAINCENVFILSRHDVKIQNIAGSNIRISDYFSPDKTFKSIPRTLKYGKITSDKSAVEVSAIEGDNISVKNIKAGLIAGDNVVIGASCTVERVEYRKSVKISDKSVVKEVVKT